MRVLIVHNSYELRGGEEEAVAADEKLLASRGHEPMLFLRRHDELLAPGAPKGAALAANAFWSRRTYDELRAIIRARRPDVAHFHNIVPLISPSGYAACHAEGVPVVQTLHNYRLVCPASTLLREGSICELCVGKVPWRAVLYRCYRGSRLQSLALAGILTAHRALGTWMRGVDAYIAVTEFGRDILLRGGLPAERVFVRPNAVFSDEPGAYRGPRTALYVGRLAPEKGVDLLLDAWSRLPDIPLAIVGTGPLEAELHERARAIGLTNVRFLGMLPHEEVLDRMREAGMLVFPSLWYETFGLVVVEGLGAGLPVIVSDIGGQAEVVRHGVSGLHFRSGDAGALVAAVRTLVEAPALAERLAAGARREFEERFEPERSYRALLGVYERAVARAS